MDEFILIFRHEDGSKIASPEQMQAWMKQTMEWMAGIAAPNRITGGNGLSFNEGKVVSSHGLVTDGPFGKIKETIGGYVLLEAVSADAAVEFARGCPILQGEGNTVEVRKIARADGLH
ncbi:MAG: YciI family protein [Bacteroidota bacterium]